MTNITSGIERHIVLPLQGKECIGSGTGGVAPG
jgi:hypothetical protein